MSGSGNPNLELRATIIEILYTTKCCNNNIAGVPMDVGELDDRISNYSRDEIKSCVESMNQDSDCPLRCATQSCYSCILTHSREAYEMVEEIRKDIYDL